MDEGLGKEPERPSNFRSPLTQPAKRSSYKQILITLLCAALLGAGTCFGFMKTFNLNGNSSFVPMVFAAVFIGCVLTFVGALIWAFARFLQNANRGN